MLNVNLATDLALTINKKKMLLIKRGKEPFKGSLVLPGGKVEETDKTVAHGCTREMEEETGAKIDPNDLRLLMVLDGPSRDPRPGKWVSLVYTIDLQTKEQLKGLTNTSEALEIVWRDIDSIKKEEIGFDHYQVIEKLREE